MPNPFEELDKQPSEALDKSRDPIRHPRLGAFLFGFGIALSMIGFVGMQLTKHPDFLRGNGHIPVFCFIVLFGSGPILAVIGKKLSAASARPLVQVLRRETLVEHVASLQRTPSNCILFLRSFKDDRYFWNLRGSMFGPWQSDEEELRNTLAPIGRMIAIGRPGESLQTPSTLR